MPGLYQSLQAERRALRTEGDAIHAAVEAASDWTDTQRSRDDEIVAQLAQIDADIERMERARRAEREAPATVVEAPAPDPTTAPTPFASLGEQLQAVYRAAVVKHQPPDQRLLDINAAAQGANETVGADGGFIVQQDIATDLLTRIYNSGILASRTRRRQIGPNSNSIKVNYLDETSRANGSRFGAVRAYWTSEAGSLTGSRPKYGTHSLDLQKLTGLYYATDELLADATALNSFVDDAFAQELAFALDDAIVNGTGTGQPEGILNANCTVSISKETGQAAATVVPENIWKMFARLWSGSARNAAWYINQDVWPQLFGLSLSVGTGGMPLFIPPGTGISSSPFGTLLGRPIEVIEHAATLGTVGDIILADLNEYLLIEKGGVARASSIHVQFTTDEMAFRWILRVNGEAIWQSALTPYKGSNTQSPFITLATRA